MSSKWIILLNLVTIMFGDNATAAMQCIKCTSETDQSCAEGKIYTSECSSEEDSCYTRIVGGHVVRGCLLDLLPDDYSNCLVDGTCRACSRSGCNNAYWPKCHTCGAADPECSEKQTNPPEFCSEISSLDYCYAKLDDDGRITRGCGFEYPMCIAEPEKCQICYADGCNGLARVDLTPSKCQQCGSSTLECTLGTSPALSKDCGRLGDYCFTAITSIASSARVLRGCSELIGDLIRSCTNSEDPLCMSCQGVNCNNKGWLRCHQCRETNLDRSCNEEHFNPYSAMFCTNYMQNDLCYTRVINGFFERGCVSDHGLDGNVCNEQGAEKCYLCDSSSCNSQMNSAVAIGLDYVAVIVGIIMTGYIQK